MMKEKQNLFNRVKHKLDGASSSRNLSLFQCSLQLLLEESFAAMNISRPVMAETLVRLRAECVNFSPVLKKNFINVNKIQYNFLE